MLSRFAGNEEQSIARLRRYWDAVVGGTSNPSDQAGLDPELAATVHHIHKQDDALNADAEFAHRLLDQLMGESRPVESRMLARVAAPAGPHVAAPVVTAVKSKRMPVRAGVSRAWAVFSAGSVVLILLAIVAGAFIWNANQEPAPAIIPLRTESTADGVLIETMLEEHVAPGMLPGNPTKWIASFKFSLEPGEAWRDSPLPCQLSRQYVVGLVESGRLAMINAGPFEVTRSDGTKASIQAGERADLNAGDSWVYLSDRTETNVQKWNPGTVPMVAYQTDWALDASCESVPTNPEWLWHDSVYEATFDPSRPVVVTFEQVFVQAGAMLSREDAARIGFVSDGSNVFSVIGVESGTLDEAVVPEALLESTLNRQESVELRTLAPGDTWSSKLLASPLEEGLEREFRAGADEPLVLTGIVWSYDDVETASDLSGNAGGMTLETIFEERFPAGSIPENATNMISNSRYILEAGEAWTDEPGRCAPVPLLVAGYVESGALALLTAGPFEVIRSGGAREAIPAGTEARLNSGDGWVYFAEPEERFTGMRNPGQEAAVVIQSAWDLTGICQPPLNANPEWVWDAYQYAHDFDADRSVVMTVETASVAPGAKLTPEEARRLGLIAADRDIFRTVAIEVGSLEEVWVPEALMQSETSPLELDTKRALGPGEVWMPQTSLTPSEGWVREYRNASDAPMVLTIVAWSYDDVDEGTDGTSTTEVDGIERIALIDHHFAADAVTRDAPSMFVMNKAVVPPGESIAYPSSCGAPTLMATAVESGVYSIQAASRIDITRADGTVETIEPNTLIELSAGDNVIYANATGESLAEFRNAGSEPLTLVQAIWFPEAGCTYGQTSSEDRSQIVWITYDRLPALDVPLEFDLDVQHVTVPGFQQLLDEEITGFAVPSSPNDNLARMAIESGAVVDEVVMIAGQSRDPVFTERYEPAAVLSLDDPLALGDNLERGLTTVSDEDVELTVFSLIYEPETG